MDISNVRRIAFDYIARVYITNHAESTLLDEQFDAWYYKQLQRFDPCSMADVSVSLTEARCYEVPGFMTPQFGHVVLVFFEETDAKNQVKQHVSEVFLRLSESGKIVELLPFRQTIH